MDDRNRRDRGYRNSQQYSQSEDQYNSRQAEQFEDSSGYSQTDTWTDGDGYIRRRGERARPVGMYYEEYIVRSPRRDRSRERDDRMAAEAYAARGDRSGRERYDNGYGYFTSESQGGRDFTGMS